jgi:hypothetical protein
LHLASLIQLAIKHIAISPTFLPIYPLDYK